MNKALIRLFNRLVAAGLDCHLVGGTHIEWELNGDNDEALGRFAASCDDDQYGWFCRHTSILDCGTTVVLRP